MPHFKKNKQKKLFLDNQLFCLKVYCIKLTNGSPNNLQHTPPLNSDANKL